MPLVAINIDDDGRIWRNADDGGPAPAELVGALAPGAAITVLVHGYKFSPRLDAHSPHTHILALKPTRPGRNLSWPRHLGFAGRGPGGDLCLAVGWEARGTIWRAYRNAGTAGRALAGLVTSLLAVAEPRPVTVNFFAHSLGARVVIEATRQLKAGQVGNVVLLSAAEFAAAGSAAIREPAGATARFLNVTSRENAPFDWLFERFLQAPTGCQRSIGGGLGEVAENWLDLPIDCGHARAALARLGHRIPAPARRICHWSGYMRPGVFGLYARFLRNGLPLGDLRAALDGRAHVSE